MKSAALLGTLLGVSIAMASGAAPEMNQEFVLTTIDSVPTRTQLDTALGSAPPPSQQLIAIAQDPSGSGDTGVRLRAINALIQYCPCGSNDPVHGALAALIPTAQEAAQLTGADLVVLRAAIESLGALKLPDDLTRLSPLLNHPSRDIRAAAARALGELCNTAAINDLRIRYQNEPSDQVKLAISATLRILSQPANCQ